MVKRKKKKEAYIALYQPDYDEHGGYYDERANWVPNEKPDLEIHKFKTIKALEKFLIDLAHEEYIIEEDDIYKPLYELAHHKKGSQIDTGDGGWINITKE